MAVSKDYLTTHGKFRIVTGDDAARYAVASLDGLLKAEQPPALQALAQTQPEMAAVFGVVLAGLSAAATAASAVGSTASAGAAIAGLFTSGKSTATCPYDTVEIEVTNNSSNILVLFAANSSHIDVTEMIGPLLPGQTDTIVCTKQPVTGKSQISLNFLLGHQVSNTSADEVNFQVKYNYDDGSDPGMWHLVVGVDNLTDGQAIDVYKTIQLQDDTGPPLQGARYLANPGSSTPSFACFTTPVETPSGIMQLMVTDYYS